MAETKTTLHIEDEMRSSFLDYAMSVIISRALPDVRDGLKPVHRRVLYAMQQLKNTHAQPYKKSARVVGDVIGKYHPHGDQSVYDALVRLAQDFAMRYPLVDGQGNFGSIDGDSPAAMRYTEVRMQKLTSEMLADLDKQTVDWVPNYDEKELEPSVLPTKVPNLLLNGAVGIAVGMATNIPPHNLTELIDATIALIDEPSPGAVGVLQLLDHVKGPDFPTGGIILGTAGIKQAYTSGRGNVTVRARCEIEVDDKGREAIAISEIPYQVNKTRLIERIAELVREKKIEGISDVQDYSDRRGMRIWIQVKKDAVAQIVLNKLYKMSDLQTSFGVNMIAIVNGRPEVLNLEKCLRHFIDHRRTVVTRRCRFDLRKAMERREIVEGLGVAIDAIDRIIELIRSSRDPEQAKARLCAEPLHGYAGFLERCGRPAEEIEQAKQGPYRLSERQAKAILDMRLQRLTGLEQEKIEGEYKELSALIAELEAILTDPKKLMGVIRGELLAIRHEYGDPEGQTSGTGGGGKGSRRTEIVPDEDEIQPIDLVADESMVVAITRGGYVKRMPTTEYRVQARGGVGLNAGTTRDDDDQVIELFEASAHAWILLFTNTGRVFRKRVFEFPLGTRGQRPKALVNFLELKEGEQVLEMVPYREDEVDDDHFVVLASREGYIKRTSLAEYANIRASGLIAATVAEGDGLIDAKLTNGNCDIIMVSRAGQAIRFAEDQVRPMGRTARGVKGMGLRKGDEVVNILVHDRSESEDEITFLTVCEHGYGKRTPAAEYGVQNRSGLGLKAIKASKRNGKVVGMVKVREGDQLMVVTTGGKIIRTPVAGISVLGRATQGVRLIRLAEGETVSGLARIDDAQAGELSEAEALEAEELEDGEELDEGEDGEELDEAEDEEGEGDEGESEDQE